MNGRNIGRHQCIIFQLLHESSPTNSYGFVCLPTFIVLFSCWKIMMESSNIQTLERTIQLFILMGHISITTSIIFYNLNNGTKTLKHSTEKYQPLISLANTQTYQTIMIIINFRNFVQTFITSRTPTIKIVSNFWFSNHLSLFFFLY